MTTHTEPKLKQEILPFLQLMSSTNRMRIRIVLRVACLATLLASSYCAAGVDLNNPTALAFGHSGNLFFEARNTGTIVKFAPDGTKTTFATRTKDMAINGDLAVDASGNVFTRGNLALTRNVLRSTTRRARAIRHRSFTNSMVTNGRSSIHQPTNHGQLLDSQMDRFKHCALIRAQG
jgi:hypothetical protein